MTPVQSSETHFVSESKLNQFSFQIRVISVVVGIETHVLSNLNSNNVERIYVCDCFCDCTEFYDCKSLTL